MNKIFLFLSFLVFNSLCFSQKKAVTETGEEVLLYEDGTWKYVNESKEEKSEIPLNPQNFAKSKTSTFLLKSTKANFGVWLDSKKWQFNKSENNEEAEYELHLKGKDLYGMMIIEKIEIPLESLMNIALKNAKDVAPDVKVIKTEYRTVNNKKILFMQMNGTMEGVKFAYYGYYFSNGSGTIQFVTYTSQNLLNDYLSDAEELLNGLVELN